MSKTITIQVNDGEFDLFEKAALGTHRSVPNFVHFAALSFLNSNSIASDEEMNELLSNPELMKSLEQGVKDADEGKYRIVG